MGAVLSLWLFVCLCILPFSSTLTFLVFLPFASTMQQQQLQPTGQSHSFAATLGLIRIRSSGYQFRYQVYLEDNMVRISLSGD